MAKDLSFLIGLGYTTDAYIVVWRENILQTLSTKDIKDSKDSN